MSKLLINFPYGGPVILESFEYDYTGEFLRVVGEVATENNVSPELLKGMTLTKHDIEIQSWFDKGNGGPDDGAVRLRKHHEGYSSIRINFDEQCKACVFPRRCGEKGVCPRPMVQTILSAKEIIQNRCADKSL